MALTLNHTIVPARDKQAAARFFASIFGLEVKEGGHFAAIQVNDTLTLDFADSEGFEPHHYAFHVSDAEFDSIFSRVKAADISFSADPFARQPGQINHWNGGRGVYFRDPDGHVLELLTRTG
ncbi:MAG: VOC family protein [Acetobacteraceae bacterium]|nr:VOC family protein [Acetobacteraceae bacterium]